MKLVHCIFIVYLKTILKLTLLIQIDTTGQQAACARGQGSHPHWDQHPNTQSQYL